MAIRSLAIPLALALALAVPPLSAIAQTSGQQPSPSSRGDGENGSTGVTPEFYPAPSDRPRGTVSDEVTELIIRDFAEARAICNRVPHPEYTVDCLSQALGRIAAKMPRGDYERAKTVLEQAARDLGALASANRDRTRPQIRLRQPSGETTPPISPVRRDALAEVNAAAAQILEEAETRLLRSAEGSARRMVHYQRIAAAVGSTKVLLRSA
ncbi:hypothetical protein [Rhodovulum steppense]|uniref:Uncharacterized protein n=1 Tax=Rhodovulum steppense TaxID=540251 RepID=A0A4R1YJQ1_9RHOB|nr:hypothetical protein [Rhodovulum steppense]TCM76983.1 hypothetical protein EV216_13136 [Rhodovulum steppense]